MKSILFQGAFIGLLYSLTVYGQTPDPKLVARGKVLFSTNCTACHNRDPSKKGSVGPELVGTPLEVMLVKVPEGKYPPGYKSKRTTRIMKLFPHLKKDVPAIHAYINTFAH